MKISSFTHRCTIREGDMAGNTYEEEVNIFNMDDACKHCGDQLATDQDLIRHIYNELTD